MRRTSTTLVAAAVAAASLAACTTMGTGTGSTLSGSDAATFTWTSNDGGTTGTMTATFADGRTYAGPYVELTSRSQSTQLAPIWVGWRHGWRDWDYGYWGDTVSYTGRVVANLQAGDSTRMRCRFDLNDPAGGMGSGGQGRCQLADGATLEATFPKT